MSTFKTMKIVEFGGEEDLALDTGKAFKVALDEAQKILKLAIEEVSFVVLVPRRIKDWLHDGSYKSVCSKYSRIAKELNVPISSSEFSFKFLETAASLESRGDNLGSNERRIILDFVEILWSRLFAKALQRRRGSRVSVVGRANAISASCVVQARICW